MQTPTDLLRAKEAQGLVWSMTARLVLCLLVIVTSIRDAVGFSLFFGGVAFALYCIYLARRERHLLKIGLAGVGFDLCLITVVAILMQQDFVEIAVPPSFVLKSPLILLMIDLVVINAMALRPLYPALVAAGSLIVELSLIGVSLQQQGVVVTTDAVEAMSSSAIDTNRLVGDVATLVVVGLFLTAMSHAARRLVLGIVDLEQQNRQLVQERGQLLMDFRMAGLAKLVAGVAHEFNTPLGASISSADTVQTCASRLGSSIESAQDDRALKEDTKVSRSLGALGDAGLVIKDAGKRMSSVVQSLKDFSRLDEAEVQQSDIAAALRNSLTLVTADDRGEVRIVENYEDVPSIMCRPKEMNQAFLSLLLYSFQAMEGRGTLHLDVRCEDQVIAIGIRDTSKGMSEVERKEIFEMSFGRKQGRMGMDLDLPTVGLVVERHGGNISVESQVGKGTSFLIRLPLAGIESVDPPPTA